MNAELTKILLGLNYVCEKFLNFILNFTKTSLKNLFFSHAKRTLILSLKKKVHLCVYVCVCECGENWNFLLTQRHIASMQFLTREKSDRRKAAIFLLSAYLTFFTFDKNKKSRKTFVLNRVAIKCCNCETKI